MRERAPRCFRRGHRFRVVDDRRTVHFFSGIAGVRRGRRPEFVAEPAGAGSRCTATILLTLLLCAAALPVSAQDIALRTAQALDGHGRALRDAVIVIRAGRIVSVDTGGAVPAGAREIDLRGYTVLPGLIDAHVHITAHFSDDRDERPSQTALHAAHNARVLVESGFTTVRSLGSPGFVDVDLRDAVAAGLVVGPRLLVSGNGLTDRIAPGTEGDVVTGGSAPADRAAIEAYVQQQIAGNVDWIKVFGTRSSRAGGTPVYSQEQLGWAVAAATRAGKPVAVHAHAAEGARRAILGGARTVEHGGLLDEPVLDLMVQRGVYFAPNLYLSEYYLEHADRFGFSAEALEWTRKLLPTRTAAFRAAVAKGVRIIFSTDANSGWISSGETAREFERRVAAGQSPLQAIVSATSLAAEALLLADDVGDLRPGLRADIIAVDGDPLQDVAALGRVVFVMKDGSVVKPLVGR